MVSFVVVSHQMQQSVQNESTNILFEMERSRFERLIICSLRRDQNIAQIDLIIRERQNISWLVEATILAIVLPHHLVSDEHDRERTIRNIQILDQRRNK